MGMQAFAEVVGLPLFFVDTAVPEDAGNGNVRVTNCVTRNGILIPQFEVIMHATKLVLAGRLVAECALGIFNQEMVTVLRH